MHTPESFCIAHFLLEMVQLSGLYSSIMLNANYRKDRMKSTRTLGVIGLVFGVFAFSFQPVLAEGSGLSSVQIQSILSLLSSFGASASVVNNVETALNGGTPSSTSTSTSTSSSANQTGSSGQTTTSSLTVLSPAQGASFSAGQSIPISWNGGTDKVQLGLVDSGYDVDARVLGWISLNEKTSGTFTWDGTTVFDITDTVSQSVSSFSTGPYKIIAVSSGTTKNFCVVKDKGCNYTLTSGYFSIRVPQKFQDISVSCAPTVNAVQTGDTVTWTATSTSGTAPFVYNWNGTDGISALTPRTTDSRFLDVRYLRATPATKIAEVTVRDATGKQGSASCASAISVTEAPPTVVVTSPLGGENFSMTRTADTSQAMLVSWKLNGSARYGKEAIKISLQDIWGRQCVVGSVPRTSSTAFVSLINGFSCSSGNFILSPGQYFVKVYLEGKETTAFGISNSAVTLTAPVADPESITPSASTIKTGESVAFHFVFPENSIKNSLYIFCPTEVTVTPANSCNRYISIPVSMASTTDYTATFVNTSSKVQNISANFYVYLPNNPNFGRGVPTSVNVLPTPSVNESVLSVLAPNGGETFYQGTSYQYRFIAMQQGVVDLTLVPYPPIDAGLVCKIATNIPASSGQISFTIPSSGACAGGPAQLILGDYRLLATLRDGTTQIATDLGDSFFTVRAPSSSSSGN